jgi:hypothetical protein
LSWESSMDAVMNTTDSLLSQQCEMLWCQSNDYSPWTLRTSLLLGMQTCENV